MGLFSFLRSVYDLDTLDTRFTVSSSTSYKTVVDARKDSIAKNGVDKRISSKAQPSKWNTPEFYLYYLVFLICVPLMFWIPYQVSKRMLFAQLHTTRRLTGFQLLIHAFTSTNITCLQDGFPEDK